MQDFKNLRYHFLYWIFPSLVIGTLIALYYSQNVDLQAIVSPKPPQNREFGWLEYFQNIVLITILVIIGIGLKRAEFKRQKIFLCIMGLGMLFMLMEEIDYGLHYIEYLEGRSYEEQRQVRNLHNQGDNTDRLKRISDAILLFVFLVAPWVVRPHWNRWVVYFTPTRLFTLSVISMVLLSETAHSLQDNGYGVSNGSEGPLSSNVSEFRELFVYWVWLLYFHCLILRKQWPEKRDPLSNSQ